MELKGRLGAIAGMVPVCRTVCDIGTDHAYIPIYLVSGDICGKAVATDVRKGPLQVAGENILSFGLDDRIELRLGDGLEPLREGEAEVIVIAGMGGALIRDLLEQGRSKAVKAQKLVLQPMKAPELVREWLCENGFEITGEELAEEEGKIYTLIGAHWTGVCTRLTPAELQVGSVSLHHNLPLLRKYIDKKNSQLETMIKGLQQSETQSEEAVEYEKLLRKLVRLSKELEG